MKSSRCFQVLRSTVFPALVSFTLIVSALVTPVRAESQHLAMGNPSQATTDTSQKSNFLMTKEYFALSYNNSKGTPNWVSWNLVKADLGDAPRKPFHPDQTLPDSATPSEVTSATAQAK